MGSRLLACALVLVPMGAAQSGVWTQVPLVGPMPQACQAIGYDALRQKVVSLANSTGNLETWELDAAGWRLRATQPLPSGVGINLSAMAFDSSAGRLRLVVVTASASALWEWDGVSWQVVGSSLAAPLTRIDGIAYDVQRLALVVVGSQRSPATTLETWTFDSAGWRPGGVCPFWGSQGLAYDPVRGEVIAAAAGQWTFSWNGSGWRQLVGSYVTGVLGPLVTDTVHQRVFAGNHEWDGGMWHEVDARPAFPGPYAHDAGRDLWIAQVAATATSPASTWRFDRWPDDAAFLSTIGTSCGGMWTQPILQPYSSSTSSSRVGRSFILQVLNAQLGMAFFVTGVNRQAWLGNPLPLDLAPIGAPGCMALVAPDQCQLGVGSNAVFWSCAVPFLAGLIGVDVYAQAVLPAPGANAAGFLLSNACQIHIGSR